jgi:hypothetical protein
MLEDVVLVVELKLEGEVGGIVDVPEGVPQLIPCTQQREDWLNT